MIRVKKWFGALLATAMISTVALTGCANSTKSTATNSQQVSIDKKAKYVFLFIGDGNAMPQINMAENFLGAQKGGNPEASRLSFTKFPAQGMNTTYSENSFITDSAAAGTAIATGKKTDSGVISMGSDKKTSYKTVAELAKEQGMKVGIVSSVSIDHATPAVFYAHTETRKNYYDIDLALGKSGFDYFGGGAMKKPTGPDKNQPSAYDAAKKEGYKIVNTKEDFDKLAKGAGKVMAYSPVLDGDKALPYAIDKDQNVITLADFTKKGIELLDNENGFFMMVEGGKIDWACHANDAAASIYDTLAFDDAVKEAIKFYNEHKDETLIVVTGDHETGGLTLGFAGTGYSNFYDKLKNQKVSYDTFQGKVKKYAEEHKDNAKFEDLMAEITKDFGLTTDKNNEEMGLTDYEIKKLQDAFKLSMKAQNSEDPYAFAKTYNDEQKLLYGNYDPLTVTVTHILNQKAGLAWTSYSHTGVPVPTFAQGVQEQLFNGYYDNTDIFTKLKDAIGIK